MEALVARGRQAAATAAAGSAQAALTAAEAARIAERLRAFDIGEVGTPAWYAQHEWLEQLNLQAHLNAQAHADEFVKEALVSLDRLTPLVQEMLVAEVWRERVLPRLERHLAQRLDSVASYQLLYHEAALANLLEVLLFHRDACEAVAEEALIELCDWCARAVAYLTSDAHLHAAWKERSAAELVALSPLEELRERAAEVRFSAAQCGLTILRYITDHAPHLSLSVLARVVSTNDTAMALLPLLERPPWVRRGKGNALERFSGGAWQPVEAAERHRLGQQDGQVWLLLYNLLADGAARARMDMTEGRCEALLRLRRHFNELLFDQLPVLKDVQRVIDELAFGVNACQPVATPARLIVEQVPQLRARLLARSPAEWDALAQRQAAEQFGAAATALSRQRLERMMRSFELMCGMEERETGSRQRESGPPTSVKVDAYRQVKPGVWEWWSTYTLQINQEKPVEPVSSGGSSGGKTGAGSAGSGSSASNGQAGPAAAAANENQPRQPSSDGSTAAAGSGAAVKGKRYRLLPLSENLQRALPAQGKLAVLYGGHTCEAALSLPASETRDTSGLAPAVWLTVGSLGGSGLALQLKLKRQDRPSERDKEAGVWFPYVPVGGALAVRDGMLDE